MVADHEKKREPSANDRKVSPRAVLTVKGSSEWKDWLKRASRHCRLNVASLIDLAVAEYVERHGFKEEPPKR